MPAAEGPRLCDCVVAGPVGLNSWSMILLESLTKRYMIALE